VPDVKPFPGKHHVHCTHTICNFASSVGRLTKIEDVPLMDFIGQEQYLPYVYE
jgi:hypothetical protein